MNIYCQVNKISLPIDTFRHNILCMTKQNTPYIVKNSLFFCSEDIVWQEVPQETSLAFLIAGCPLRCHGCHSADSWHPQQAQALSADYLRQRLHIYRGLITCLLFMGGEWQPQALQELLRIARAQGLKTCLYTGAELEDLQQLTPPLLPYLDYVKTGPWKADLGGLDNPCSNQRFIEVSSGKVLNHLFLARNANTNTVSVY